MTRDRDFAELEAEFFRRGDAFATQRVEPVDDFADLDAEREGGAGQSGGSRRRRLVAAGTGLVAVVGAAVFAVAGDAGNEATVVDQSAVQEAAVVALPRQSAKTQVEASDAPSPASVVTSLSSDARSVSVGTAPSLVARQAPNSAVPPQVKHKRRGRARTASRANRVAPHGRRSAPIARDRTSKPQRTRTSVARSRTTGRRSRW